MNICLCGCNQTVKYKDSKFCHGHHLRLKKFQRKKSPSVINNCNFCKKDFISKKSHTLKQSFCSRHCARKSFAKGEYVNCLNCLKSFYLPAHRLKETKTRGKYCSNLCRLSYWEKKSLVRQAPGQYRENAWKAYEKKCYDCGLTDKRILVIHHIDGNRQNGKITNLIPVCHNCHCIRHIEMDGNHRMPSYRG